MVSELERMLYEALKEARDWVWLGDEAPELAKVDAALAAYDEKTKDKKHGN